MRHLITYSLLIYHLIGLIYCDDETPDEARGVKSLKNVGMSVNHPSQNGYQSVVHGTEKHRYGYEIKHQGKHFHHTNTEKDGVRLGCYGYEVAGKQYLTQYVADTKGYRLVSTEDLIIVHPKSGRTGKAVFADDFNIDDDDENASPRNAAARYVFPKGCKGIDVEIDNSSRLRSLASTRNFEISPRLPVNLPNRTDHGDKYTYYKPSSSYPGPSHIYAPSSNVYDYINPSNNYLPPHNSQSDIYQPPPKPSTSISPPVIIHKPSIFYDPPKEESPANSCSPNCLCEESKGQLIIPIPLKNRNSNDCCQKTAQLILPVKSLDITIVAQLREKISQQELNADELIRDILQNLI